MKKIAVCLSGQPRTWKKCIEGWNNFFADWGQVDYFCHLWDFNSESALVQHLKGPSPDVKISEEEKQEIITTLQPKKIIFEADKPIGLIEYTPHVKNQIAPWNRSQFYSVFRAAMLKREYEIENDFEYDVAVRMRTDLVFKSSITLPSIIKPSTIYSTHNNVLDKDFQVYRMGDIFYFSDSLTFDHLAMFGLSHSFIDAHDVVWPNINPAFPPEIAFYYYCAATGITNMPIHLSIKVMRTQEQVQRMGCILPYETV